MKKKLLIPLFCLCLIFMTSCGGNKTASNDADNVTLPSQEEVTPNSRNTAKHKDNARDDDAERTEEKLEDFREDVEKIKSKDAQSDAQTPNPEKTNDDADKDNADKNDAAENEKANENTELVDGMRPEFKEAMDSYEAFYDKYCDIIKKYSENPTDLRILADYTDMLTKSAEMREKFDAWEDSDLNNAELKYYLDVQNRIAKKLLEAAE